MDFAKFSSSSPFSRSRLITKQSRSQSPFFARLRQSQSADLLGLPRCKNLWRFSFFCICCCQWLGSIVLTSLFSLFYVTGECHRFLHRG